MFSSGFVVGLCWAPLKETVHVHFGLSRQPPVGSVRSLPSLFPQAVPHFMFFCFENSARMWHATCQTEEVEVGSQGSPWQVFSLNFEQKHTKNRL